MSAAPAYERLPGLGAAFNSAGSVETLYLAPDHLLVLHRAGATESAHRYGYRDIQGIACVKTHAGIYANAVLAALTLAFAALAYSAYYSGQDFGWILVAAFPAVPFFLCLVLNVLRGATCITTLYTAVSVQRLHSLRRIPAARRGIERLVQRIEAAQGPLDVERAAAHLRAQAGGAAPSLPVARYRAPALRVRPRERAWHSSAAAHAWFFGLLALMAFSSALDYLVDNAVKDTADLVLFLAIVAVGVAAVIRQRHSGLGPALRRATSVSLGIQVVLTFFLINFLVMFGGFQGAGFDEAGAPLSPDAVREGYRLMTVTLTLVTSAVCALWGLTALLAERRADRPSGGAGADAA